MELLLKDTPDRNKDTFSLQWTLYTRMTTIATRKKNVWSSRFNLENVVYMLLHYVRPMCVCVCIYEGVCKGL